MIEQLPGDEPLLIAGDFNQRIPRLRQPIAVAENLAACLDGLKVATAGEQAAGRLIDHVALSPELDVAAVASWPNVIDGKRISDHSGCAVTIA